MSDEPLKSSYELAMDKLRARDRERGIAEETALTAEQKGRIAEIRSQAKAKQAELEILWKTQRREAAHDPDALLKAEQQYIADRARVEERADAQIEKIHHEH